MSFADRLKSLAFSSHPAAYHSRTIMGTWGPYLAFAAIIVLLG